MYNGRATRVFLPLLLFFISARVLTGAAEAQVNFTSLLVDGHSHSVVIKHFDAKSQAVPRTPSRAGSIPENFKKYSLYKKYIPPKSFDLLLPQSSIGKQVSSITYFSEKQYSAFLRVIESVSNSPPVTSNSPTHTFNKSLEFGFNGEINNSGNRELSGI